MRLFEVIQLMEYNKGATLNKWGERIAQAAEFNRIHLSDSWFRSNDLGLLNYDPDGPEAEEFIAGKVLEELEKIDPTKNKQYVMTLVRWYIGSIKKHKQLQYQYDDWRRDANLDRYGEMDYADSSYPEDYYDLESIADEFDDFHDDFGNYVMNAENLNTFMLEDAEQIRTALAHFERMKPQLQPNERDIGRYKTFYRFEDFVDSKLDPELKAEIENELLNRSDVKVLYNGPMGTVAIPHSHEASCKLGSGTKWCTTNKSPSLYDHYSEKGDLMIYNEKPGNEKYQIHVTLDGIEIRDSRDRTLPRTKYNEFTQTHPVISKLIQKKADEIFTIAAQQPWTTDAITSDGGDPTRLVRDFIKFNKKHQGGVMRYVDEYYTKFALPSILNSKVTIPNREMVDLMLTYAKQRGKPWPEMMDLMIQILRKAADRADFSSNIELKSINRLVTQLDTMGSNPKLEQFKSLLLSKIQNPSVQ